MLPQGENSAGNGWGSSPRKVTGMPAAEGRRFWWFLMPAEWNVLMRSLHGSGWVRCREMLWGGLGGVMDNMSAAWRVGLLWFNQRQCGLVEDSYLLAPCVCMHMCVRVRTEPVSRRCLVAELWLGVGF